MKTRPSIGAQRSVVHRPSGGTRRQEQGIEARLLHVEQVLGVQEEASRAEPPLHEQAQDQVRPTGLAEGVVLQRLPPRIVYRRSGSISVERR